MHPAFVFQSAIDIAAGDRYYDLLEATDGTFGITCDIELPATTFAVTLVHLEQVTGKQRGLVTACTAAYLKYGIPRVLRVGRYKLQFYLLLQVRQSCTCLFKLLMSHLPYIRVGLAFKQTARLVNIGKQTTVSVYSPCQLFKFLILARQLYIATLVCNNRRISNQRGYFGETCIQTFEAVKYGISRIYRHDCSVLSLSASAPSFPALLSSGASPEPICFCLAASSIAIISSVRDTHGRLPNISSTSCVKMTSFS